MAEVTFFEKYNLLLISLLQLSKQPVAERPRMVQMLIVNVFQRVFVRIIKLVEGDERARVTALLSEISNNVSNDQIVATTFATLQAELKDVVNQQEFYDAVADEAAYVFNKVLNKVKNSLSSDEIHELQERFKLLFPSE